MKTKSKSTKVARGALAPVAERMHTPAGSTGGGTVPAGLATSADLDAVAALPASATSHAHTPSRASVDLLANPAHAAALRAHAGTLADEGVDIEAAITEATARAADFDRAARLQQAADRAWDLAESSNELVKLAASAVYNAGKKASRNSPLARDFGAFVTARGSALGVGKRAAAFRKKARAKNKAAKAKG